MCSRQREKYKKEPPAVLLAGSKQYHRKIASSTSEHRFFLNAGHYVFEGTPYKVA